MIVLICLRGRSSTPKSGVSMLKVFSSTDTCVKTPPERRIITAVWSANECPVFFMARMVARAFAPRRGSSGLLQGEYLVALLADTDPPDLGDVGFPIAIECITSLS